MNIVMMLAHAVEEYDQVKLLAGLGHDVFSIGAYSEPANPGDDARPALPDVPDHPELREACAEHRRRYEAMMGEPGPRVDWAKAMLPQAVLDWADTIICHHIEWEWLKPQWPLIRDKRVIWRTVGQSVENNENVMRPLREDGLQIVRYSPKERNIPGYLGEDALIRFYKDPDEWYGWTGEDRVVLNVTQKLKQRDPWTNYRFWEKATAGLPTRTAGEGSEEIGGLGRVTYDEMRAQLRKCRVYLSCGTQPASYVLSFIEALMTGVPVVSIGPKWMDAFPYGPDLFEAHELAVHWAGAPNVAASMLQTALDTPSIAETWSALQREMAISTFGRETIARQWAEFLG